MSVEDPLVNGIPLSSLRVIDLRDELEKRGLSKIGNKSVLTERLKAVRCCSLHFLVVFSLWPSNTVKRQDCNVLLQTSIFALPLCFPVTFFFLEQTAAGNASEQDSSVEPSMVPRHVEKSAATSAKKSPSSTPNRQKTPDQQTEMDEINDEEKSLQASIMSPNKSYKTCQARWSTILALDHSLSKNLYRHPESEIVHIRGLTRPFTDRALKAEITKCGGQIVDFWIDSVKSHCIVQMNSIDEAREVRNAMHNTQWPAANPKTLSVQFDTKENVWIIFLSLSSIFVLLCTDTRREEEEGKKEKKRHRSETPPFSRSVTEKRERRRHRHHENEKEKEREEKPVKTADSLFMKTKTQPAIYFLPLTDEEVGK
uniref:SAP domain-containing protein n=1 Tax=Angiostrongylus cantonensis TaxID=6313 RepID=A0A158PBR7_ANGCA